MPADISGTGKYRPLLLAAAIVFAAATVTYSVGWMYYFRAAIQVEVGMDTTPLSNGLEIRDVYPDSPAQRAGLRAKDVIVAINGRDVTVPEGLKS